MRLKETLTSATLAVGLALAVPGSALPQEDMAAAAGTTATPIQHVVIIFQENVSFDHYFATYPIAKNSDGSSFRRSADAAFVGNHDVQFC